APIEATTAARTRATGRRDDMPTASGTVLGKGGWLKGVPCPTDVSAASIQQNPSRARNRREVWRRRRPQCAACIELGDQEKWRVVPAGRGRAIVRITQRPNPTNHPSPKRKRGTSQVPQLWHGLPTVP